MKRLLYTLGFLLSILSLQAVEIKNNTTKSIQFDDFKTINGRKIIIRPFSVNPGQTYDDFNIASCMATIEYKTEDNCLRRLEGVDNLYILTTDTFKLNELKENTVVSFIEIDGRIEAHKLDKILPETKQIFCHGA